MSAPAESGPHVHPTAVVDAGAVIGAGTHVWHFCHVMAGASIGRDSMLGHGCFVGSRVTIGDRVRVQNHVSVFEGVAIEDDVFVGPCAVFTNVRHPRAFSMRGAAPSATAPFERTLVRRGATLGANTTVLSGIEVGEYAFVGAGALVRTDVPAHALWAGVPGKQIGWVGRQGRRLVFEGDLGVCPVTGERYRLSAGALARES